MIEEVTISDLAEACTDLQRKIVINIVSSEYKSNREAYYAAGGDAKTNESADATVSEILSEPKVKKYKNALLDQIAEESILTRSQALKILSDMANTKITDIAVYKAVELGKDDDGDPIVQGTWCLKDSGELLPEHASSIMSVKSSSQGLEIKQHDQKQAITQLSKMMGWDSPTEINHSGNIQTQVNFVGVGTSK